MVKPRGFAVEVSQLTEMLVFQREVVGVWHAVWEVRFAANNH